MKTEIPLKIRRELGGSITTVELKKTDGAGSLGILRLPEGEYLVRVSDYRNSGIPCIVRMDSNQRPKYTLMANYVSDQLRETKNLSQILSTCRVGWVPEGEYAILGTWPIAKPRNIGDVRYYYSLGQTHLAGLSNGKNVWLVGEQCEQTNLSLDQAIETVISGNVRVLLLTDGPGLTLAREKITRSNKIAVTAMPLNPFG
jgi:hypothetical protein